MNPLSLIKDGILEQDWEKVKQGYSTMTGENLAATKKKRGRPAKMASAQLIPSTINRFDEMRDGLGIPAPDEVDTKAKIENKSHRPKAKNPYRCKRCDKNMMEYVHTAVGEKGNERICRTCAESVTGDLDD